MRRAPATISRRRRATPNVAAALKTRGYGSKRCLFFHSFDILSAAKDLTLATDAMTARV